MTAESTVFYTLIERDGDGDVGTQMGSQYRQRDVRSYSKIGIARNQRTRHEGIIHARGLTSHTVGILKTTVWFDGQTETEWVS